MICENCGEKLKYQVSAVKAERYIRIFQCPKCGKGYDLQFYMYTPKNCPKHNWVFDRWNYKDNGNTHKIFWVLKCDRCGQTNETVRWDSHAVGLRQSVDLDDPRVLNLLDLNKQTARFHLPADDVTDFWSN